MLVAYSVSQSFYPFIRSPVSRSGSQSVRHSVDKSSGPSVNRSVSLSVSHSVGRPVRLPTTPSVRPSVRQSVSQCNAISQRFHLGKTKYFITCCLNCTLSYTSLTEDETILKILISATGHIEN